MCYDQSERASCRDPRKEKSDEGDQSASASHTCYRRTKDIYAQYKSSGWSPKFYNEHREEIESHKKAQTVYSSVDGKMPTLMDLSAEYDALKAAKENDEAALDKLKPQLTTLNHIKYNFEVLERDYLPEEKDLHREEHQER